ncbi:mechanosensitive ion channel family protein [Alcanivorax quisquiliarum]|uniref:Mechanosensitive ion channel family protein n=1 Tax=Alcanivorax quisquiliarum TaxID=2933565 RepID=A0ABT0E985_9GAMM|nr:mechanosensitive ion channel family protein [Alcanivorax quisquiliarum]MCK0538411.1 mechanosensitive ion channel family protein [Alcanivorax quisquiliarum]
MDWQALVEQISWADVVIATGVTVVSYCVIQFLLQAVARRLQRHSAHSDRRAIGYVASMLQHTHRTLVALFALLLGLKAATLPPAWAIPLSHGWFLVLALQAALWLDHGIREWVRGIARADGDRNPVTTLLISIMLRMLVWSVMGLSVLANLGINVTALVAGLGVGGIAVALAVQTLLSDMFASLAIGIDKPFEIGDFVVFGDVAGSIEHIGLKTTRIRSLSGEQIVCANADLLAQVVRNYKRMETRRVEFRFGITYDTDADKIRAVTRLVEQVIRDEPEARFDRAHFLAFDEQRLTIEVVYIVLSADYNRYMDIQQDINLALLSGLQEMGVRFALPIRRIEPGPAWQQMMNEDESSSPDGPLTSRH